MRKNKEIARDDDNLKPSHAKEKLASRNSDRDAEDRPTDILKAYTDAMSRGPKWRRRIERSLERAPKVAELLEAAK